MKKCRRLAVAFAVAIAVFTLGCSEKEVASEAILDEHQLLKKENLELDGQISLREKETLLAYDIYGDEILCGIITPIEEYAMRSGAVSYTRTIFIWDKEENKIKCSLELEPKKYLVSSAVISERKACFSAMPVEGDFAKDKGQRWEIFTTDFLQVALVDSGKAPFYATPGIPKIVREKDDIKYMYYDLAVPNARWGIRRIGKASVSEVEINFGDIEPRNLVTAEQNGQLAFLAVCNDTEGIAVCVDGKCCFIENKNGNIYAWAIQNKKVIYSCGEETDELYYLVVHDITTGEEKQVQTRVPLTKLVTTETFLLAGGADWRIYQVAIKEKEIKIDEYEIYPARDVFMFIPGDDEVLVNNLMDYRKMYLITEE